MDEKPKSPWWKKAVLPLTFVAGTATPIVYQNLKPTADTSVVSYDRDNIRNMADQAVDTLEVNNITRTPDRGHPHGNQEQMHYNYEFEFLVNNEKMGEFLEAYRNNKDFKNFKKEMQSVFDRNHRDEKGVVISDQQTVLELVRQYSALRHSDHTLQRGENLGEGYVVYAKGTAEEPDGLITQYAEPHGIKPGENARPIFEADRTWRRLLEIAGKGMMINGKAERQDYLERLMVWPAPPLMPAPDVPDVMIPSYDHPDSEVDFIRIDEERLKQKIRNPEPLPAISQNTAPEWGERVVRDDTPRPREV